MSRGRAWRRKKTTVKERAAERLPVSAEQREKNWKLMYTRAAKVARARQLEFDYPRRSTHNDDSDDMTP